MNKMLKKFAFMAAMMAGMSTYGMPNMFDVDPQCRSLADYNITKHYRLFRRKREDETDEEYAAAWREHCKQRLIEDCAKKGLTVFEINGELIPAKNEREAQKRYKHRHK